jgi:hypothetical protein
VCDERPDVPPDPTLYKVVRGTAVCLVGPTTVTLEYDCVCGKHVKVNATFDGLTNMVRCRCGCVMVADWNKISQGG